ncbi:MAG: NADH-quinone oxidoreductase subunit L [Leptospiraceae bacterium]|nr:NADH-quinone oxidoreductase subunit L [Leptospiraceae bacterium]MDW7975837.1 NADH-quinone oxidoreductase subunit L [Leptospiraceae bacterium]
MTELNIIEYSLLGWILLPPLLGSLINGILHISNIHKEEKPKTLSSLIAIVASGLTFILSVFAFFELIKHPEGSILKHKLWDWIFAGDYQISFSLQFDALTAVMLLFITFVATVIHIYSVGYMHEDEGFIKYFSYLNLFLFSMLTLVLGDNLVVLFIGWEGVGLCSYLLISFWYSDEEKAEAGKKAFITNRIGDAGYLVGVFILYNVVGTVTFTELLQKKEILSSIATLVGIALFIGATGKSAQIPLYVWLPDAMAGPTPVSALIHAATMVTAGVYLVARMSFLYELSPLASTVVATTGILTALFSATIAIAQYDIKKILAYSTVSQLGFMFLGVGVGAHNAGIFHVMTHAFFKALLFLGAGSVIHALHHEQDIRKMGGLLKKIPITGWTFLIAWLAIAGIPPLSGFFSKDEILWKAISIENPLVPWLPNFYFTIGIITAFLTAFYMTRLVVFTFFGEYRGSKPHFHPHREEHEHKHDHEIKEYPIMYIPLIVLAFFSVIAGFLGVPHALGGHNYIEEFLSPVVVIKQGHHVPHEWEIPLMILSVLVAVVGILFAFYVFLWKEKVSEAFVHRFPQIRYFLNNKYFVDEIYEALILKPIRGFANFVSFRTVDMLIIDGFVNNVGNVIYSLGRFLKILHNGKVQTYVVLMYLGFVLLLYLLLIQN